MFFNSWQFAVFFVVTYMLYLSLPGKRAQNILLLAASYYFYASWDWRFLSLIIISTLVDYWAGRGIAAASEAWQRKALVAASLVTNLGMLGFFKYFNFFIESFEGLVSSCGGDVSSLRLNVILPVGISFYTFQTLSYTLDIYRGTLKPTRSFLDFALFVAFFPQLVAGPIERAKSLLPQIQRPRRISQATLSSGAWLIFWGLWKKVVIADNMALLADPVFGSSESTTVLQVYLGATAFAVQIYCDFSGYSDIARGLARLMGFEIVRNFNLPFFAENPTDFWRRWHISLSRWLRDYLYIPLGGKRHGILLTYRNLLITMVLGGLWHGASANFLWWGIYHGLVLIIYRMIYASSSSVAPIVGRLRRFFNIAITYHIMLAGWMIFRATRHVTSVDGTMKSDSLTQITELFTSWRNGCGLDASMLDMIVPLCFLCAPLLAVQLLQHWTKDHYTMLKWPRSVRILFFGYLCWMWVMYGVQQGTAFIYFQF